LTGSILVVITVAIVIIYLFIILIKTSKQASDLALDWAGLGWAGLDWTNERAGSRLDEEKR
jgi:hypothetical protein